MTSRRKDDRQRIIDTRLAGTIVSYAILYTTSNLLHTSEIHSDSILPMVVS